MTRMYVVSSVDWISEPQSSMDVPQKNLVSAFTQMKPHGGLV